MNDIKFIGLDVHKTSISAAVLDESGKLVMQAVLMTNAAAVLSFLRGLRGSLRVTFEEGTHAAWLHTVLRSQVAEVVVCNPRRNALLKSGNKNDQIDARKLADLLRANMLKPVYHGRYSHTDIEGVGPYVSLSHRRHHPGDAPAESVVPQSSHRYRWQEAIHKTASGAVVDSTPATGTTLSRRTLIRAIRAAEDSAPAGTLRSDSGRTQACRHGDAEQHSLCGTDPLGTADRARADAVSLPHQASVLGLLRTRTGNAQQCRSPGDRRRAAAQQQARLYSWIESESQSRSEEHL